MFLPIPWTLLTCPMIGLIVLHRFHHFNTVREFFLAKPVDDLNVHVAYGYLEGLSPTSQ